MEKTIKEIFKDYNSNSFALNAAKIKNINLHKKTNKLEIQIISKEVIKAVDLYAFERYLEKRFNIKEALTEVEYDNEVEIDLREEWQDLIDYMAYKHPLTKALLRNSSIEVDDKNLIVNLALKGKQVLDARGFDKVLEKIVQNIYGKKLKVKYIENITEETLKRLQEEAMQYEREAIEQAQREAEEYTKEIVEKKENKSLETRNSEKKANGTPTTGENIPPFEMTGGEISPPEEKTPLIYGRSLKIKEQLVKVADLSIDSGKVLLDGEILNIDSRELKSGKVLVMFDLFDGSSTITCKAFVEGKKAKDTMKRMKGVSGVKVEGTAQFDPFAKELGVIANTIIESTGIKREARKDESKEKRVELHMHTQMSQMDAVSSATDLLKRAAKWGMKSIAITDHGVVQAFPEANHFTEKNPDLKIIYGVEAYLAPDKTPIVSFPKGQDIDTTYCVLDLETTGLSFRTEKITEVGLLEK